MKRSGIYLLFVVFIIVNIFNFYMISYLGIPDVIGTGKASNTGTVSLFIEGGIEPNFINITSPENKTYNFNIGDDYFIELNVSANFEVEDWWYDLYDLEHDTQVYDDVSFTPNTSIEAVRWGNRLEVYATDSIGAVYTDNVTFYVSVPNSAPVIEEFNDSIYVCEGSHLSFSFNVTDVDEEWITMSINPSDPFYVFPVLRQGPNITAQIVSGTISKNDVGFYPSVATASDGVYSDSEAVNITAIEINNAPEMDDIGVQTVYLQGDNNTFNYSVSVSDLESDLDEMLFNISFLDDSKLFDINSTGGMNYVPSEDDLGIYSVVVCAIDSGIDSPHENISLCGQDGENLSDCDTFELTVTNENRPPVILDYSPISTSISRSGTTNIDFTIENYDPDGTIPDSYWYVDGVFQEKDEGDLIEEFSHTFGCGVSGTHTIEAEITDGLENNSVVWSIDVGLVSCGDTGGGGGGGGGGGAVCNPKWVCDEWSACQRADRAFNANKLESESYRIVLDYCKLYVLEDIFCGYQLRECRDLNNCSTQRDKPEDIQGCHYTENPNCNDGIKNCHSGSCEVLTDCGGPCPPCPTCSDGIKNQGEEGIDCGGPCPFVCEKEKPLIKQPWMLYVLAVVGIGILVIVIIKLKRIKEYKKNIRGKNAKK